VINEIGDEKCFDGHVIMKRGDRKCFSDPVFTTMPLGCWRRGDEKILVAPSLGKKR
jgi:hypothetical protein